MGKTLKDNNIDLSEKQICVLPEHISYTIQMILDKDTSETIWESFEKPIVAEKGDRVIYGENTYRVDSKEYEYIYEPIKSTRVIVIKLYCTILNR